MRSINRVFLSGNLGNKPEKKQSKLGKHYYHASLATHRSWRNKNEEWEEKTDWHTLFFWLPKSEKDLEKLNKGDAILIEGEIITFEKEDSNGQVTKTTAIEVYDVRILLK